MERLPEKWCCKSATENELKILNDFIISKGYDGKLQDHFYIHFPFINTNGSAYTKIMDDYKEISFEDFKRLVLKENITETYEIY
jgi:hypothetical protein